jgi:hypothetical protein
MTTTYLILFVKKRLSTVFQGANSSIYFFALGCLVFLAGSFFSLYRLYLLSANESFLEKQLTSKVFKLSGMRAKVNEDKKRSVEQKALLEERQAAANRSRDILNNYFDEIPLVITTLNGKGRLVGFGRLIEANSSAQYSFMIKYEDKDVTVSGVSRLAKIFRGWAVDNFDVS